MRKILYITIAAASLAVTTGCKEFLEPRSQSEYTVTRVDQLTELIISALPDPNDTGHMALSGGYLDILSDDVMTRPTIQVTNPVSDTWYAQDYVTQVQTLYTWQPDYSKAGAYANEFMRWDDIYDNTYYKLTYVNSVLDYIDKVEGTQAQKNYVRAQALALRAFYYLNLVNIYGEPYNKGVGGQGVPIRLTGAKENRKMTRNTVGEVYDRITEDLLEAIALFEGLGETERYRQYQPTLPMALLLAARTFLYMEDWEQAEYYAQKLISDWPNFEVQDLNELVKGGKYTNLTPDNPLRQLFWPDFNTYSNPDVIWAYGSASKDATEITGREMHLRPEWVRNNILPTLTLASESLIDSYDEDDLRLRTYFVRDLYDEPDYTVQDAVDPKQNFKYRAYGKQSIRQNETGMPDDQHHFLPEDNNQTFGYSLRIAEAWLILAEAYAEQGKDGEALEALVQVQSKRFAAGEIPAVYTTGNVIELVRKERRREMCLEQLRWFDLRRWDRPEITHVWYNTAVGSQSGQMMKYVLAKDDEGYTLPMPEEIMLGNIDLIQVPVAYGGGKRPVQQ